MIYLRELRASPEPRHEVVALAPRSPSIYKSEIQTLVPVSLPGVIIILVRGLLISRHGAPDSLLLLVEIHQRLSLHHKGNEAKCTDRDEDGITALVVRRII